MSEGLSVDKVEFVDNQPCLDVIEKRPTGILCMVDEELRLPKGSDAQLLAKMHQTHEKSTPHYVKVCVCALSMQSSPLRVFIIPSRSFTTMLISCRVDGIVSIRAVSIPRHCICFSLVLSLSLSLSFTPRLSPRHPPTSAAHGQARLFDWALCGRGVLHD